MIVWQFGCFRFVFVSSTGRPLGCFFQEDLLLSPLPFFPLFPQHHLVPYPQELTSLGIRVDGNRNFVPGVLGMTVVDVGLEVLGRPVPLGIVDVRDYVALAEEQPPPDGLDRCHRQRIQVLLPRPCVRFLISLFEDPLAPLGGVIDPSQGLSLSVMCPSL